MNTKILSSFIFLCIAISAYAQTGSNQKGYWASALKNDNSKNWDTIPGCVECNSIQLSGMVIENFGTKESDRHKGNLDCDVTFNVKLDAVSASNLADIQKKYNVKTKVMPELHVEVVCANKDKTCPICSGIVPISSSALPKVNDKVSISGRLILDKGKDEDADKRMPEFEIHPAYAIVKK